MMLAEFQSAPPVETRGDEQRRYEVLALEAVSIRSPRRNEGRRLAPAFNAAALLFQSAPPVETRGDCPQCASIRPKGSFQSAPPVETRGDAGAVGLEWSRDLFQSAPPVETRGDAKKFQQ